MNDIKLEKILDHINDGQYKSISEMSKKLKIPRTTLIYYIKKLEAKNILTKKWGNVIKNIDSNLEFKTNNKIKLNTKAKKNIAFQISKLLKPKDVIFIDSGSTTGLSAQFIKDMNITIYTNNIYFINLLGLEGGSSKVFIIPGNLYTKTLSIIGSKAINEINSIKFDKCFIGINSKINNEYFTSNQEESLIKEVAIKNSKVVYMVFDKSKINVQGLKYKIKINKKVNEVVS